MVANVFTAHAIFVNEQCRRFRGKRCILADKKLLLLSPVISGQKNISRTPNSLDRSSTWTEDYKRIKPAGMIKEKNT